VRAGKPIVGISMGDPSGIGPEILAAALTRKTVRGQLLPVLFGDLHGLLRFPVFKKFRVSSPEELGRADSATLCAVTTLAASERVPGKPSAEGGAAQLAYVGCVIEAAQKGKVDAICTGPVSKEQITRSGVPFLGHTELLASSFRTDVLMLMDGPRLKVALATNHLPIADVPRALSTPKLVEQLHLLSRELGGLIGRKPRLAVTGLNPHAGEGGLLGREELEVIQPAIVQARAEGVDCNGPFAADGLFAQPGKVPYDAVLAMFHDQGLIAAKALGFERTVNVTLGLPVPRTSPDHGVAYPLAGKRRASAEPMVHALLKAAELARAHLRRDARRLAQVGASAAAR
jgi:4-hydroxythreonine-4-phosphate dehydrogenase